MSENAIEINEPDEFMKLRGFSPLHAPVPLVHANRDEWLAHRAKTIGGTDTPALFEGLLENESYGDDAANAILSANLPIKESLELSPYQTLWGLFMDKKGLVPKDPTGNKRMGWGTRLEDPIAYGIAEEYGLTIRKAPNYYLHPRVERMGASLDFEVLVTTETESFHVPFEIKNVSSTEIGKWTIADGRRAVPPHIALQVQHQLAVTGAPFAYIGVLFDGSNAELLKLHRRDEIVRAIETAVEDFWRRFDNDEVPLPDYERDAILIKQIYAESHPDSIADWRQDPQAKALVTRYQALDTEKKRLRAALKEIEDEIVPLQSELIHMLGENESGDLGTILFVAKTMPERKVESVVKTHRRVTIKKKK